MINVVYAERRGKPRYTGDGLVVRVRRKGRLAQLEGLVLDYNRFGLGVVLDQPLSKNSLVYLSLHSGDVKLNKVLGIVHNCTSITGGYRCGIQFRIDAHLQFDQPAIERELTILEARLKTLQHAG